MRSTFTIAIVTLVLASVIVTGAGLAYIYSGRYNVAAAEPHNALSRWILRTTLKNSIKAHAQQVSAPPELSAEQRSHGVEHYKDTCVVCHGAPGLKRGELGKGFKPMPPDLAKAVPQWSERELFWIVKHGIKFTGMPAFGPTHTDEELWQLVDFLQRLPKMSPEQYRQATGETAGNSASSPSGLRHHHQHHHH